MNLKQKVNIFLKENGSSQPDFAARIGVNYQVMNRNIAAGKLTTDVVYGFLKEFPHIDMNWLLKEEKHVNQVNEAGEEYEVSPKALILKLRQTLDELEKKIIP